MFGIFKKKLHKKILVLSALPDDKESFYHMVELGQSDFIKSLCDLYKTNDCEMVWKKYRSTAKKIKKTLSSLRKRGVDIVSQFTLSDCKKMSDYDIIIIFAHHSNNADEIELGDGCVSSTLFVSSIPEVTTAIIDMTSCYSSYLIPRIKGHIPNSRIIGIDVATSLPFRLFLLNEAIDFIANNPSFSYIDALKKILALLPSVDGEVQESNEDKTIHLGKKDLKSTVAAPSKAFKGEDFIVSVFIHKNENLDEVELLAKAIDENATIKNSKKMVMNIKKGDRIDFQLSMSENISPFFTVEKNKQTILWDGETNSVEFIVSIAESCNVSNFIGCVHVYVNLEPQFDMLFKTEIVDKTSINAQCLSKTDCANIEFVNYDKDKESTNARQFLETRLKNRIKEITDAHNEKDKNWDSLQTELDMCNQCLHIIENANKKTPNTILKTFISSTSDMKNYRDVIKERVLALGMYPDMYEMWGQGNDYPRDMCCKHVLDADIFICILGPKYGFIEPIWDKSMTEIEYRIALNANIPILIYIIKNYKQEIDEIATWDKESAMRQLNFIDELSSKRMVSLFSNKNALALIADPELLTLKYHLQS